MTANDVVLLGLRLAVVLVLYLFLVWAVRALWSDLRRSVPSREVTPRAALGHLVLLDGASGDTDRETLPVQAVTTVGRSADNSLVLDDEFVSAHHAALRLQADGWWLVDLGSTNGTWLDDRRVEKPIQVRGGSTVRFGRVRARFET